MELSSYNQAEILRQMRVERLLAVREQAKRHSSKRTGGYCENKLHLKQQLCAEKRKENVQNRQKEHQRLEQKLHRVLLDTGAGHDAAEHFKKHELARQKNLLTRAEKLQKKQIKHAQESALRLQRETAATQASKLFTAKLAENRDEQSLLDREAAHLQAESLAARRAVRIRSKQREDVIAAKLAHSHQQEHTEQGAVSILQRGRVVVQARVTRHGASTESDSAIVINQSEGFKDGLNKTRKDNVLKELVSRHVIQARNQQAKKISMDSNAFTNIEESFTLLSSLDRANDRRNRLKNTEDVRRRNTTQKDTRLTGGTGRNPASYDALIRQNFEKDFFGTESSAKMLASGRRSDEAWAEHSHNSWKKLSEEATEVSKTASVASGSRKANTDTGLKKPLKVSPVKKPSSKSMVNISAPDLSEPQWRSVNPVAQSLSSGLLGEETLVPAQEASFLTQEDPYLGVGAYEENRSPQSSATSEVEGGNVYELLDKMAHADDKGTSVKKRAGEALHWVDHLGDTGKGYVLDSVYTSSISMREKHQQEQWVSVEESHKQQHGDDFSYQEQLLSTSVDSNLMYSPSPSSSSGSSSISSGGDGESNHFQHVFEFDAVSQHTPAPTLSPAVEYSPAQLLHEPVGDSRRDRIGGMERKFFDAFSLGGTDKPASLDDDAGVYLDSLTVMSGKEAGAVVNTGAEDAVARGMVHHSYEALVPSEVEEAERSVAQDVLDLSDDSLRVDPSRYEKYMQDISTESLRSAQSSFLLDPFSEDEQTGCMTPPIAPLVAVAEPTTPTPVHTLTIATTPGSIDSDDKMLNAMAKKSSGSNRARANFSIDSNDVVIKGGVVVGIQQEYKDHSVTSEATVEAHHDASYDHFVDNSLTLHHRSITLSTVSPGDIFVGNNVSTSTHSSLSSVSGEDALDQDSLSEQRGEMLGGKSQTRRSEQLSDSTLKLLHGEEKSNKEKRDVCSVTDDDSDDMSCDSMRESESHNHDYSQTTDSVKLLWQIPSVSSGGSNMSRDSCDDIQYQLTQRSLSEMISRDPFETVCEEEKTEDKVASDKECTTETTDIIQSDLSAPKRLELRNVLVESPVGSEAFSLSYDSNYGSSVEAEGILCQEGLDDDASEITMEWETLVNKLDVYSSSAVVGGDGDSTSGIFSSVASSSLFVSDTEHQSRDESRDNYIDNESDGHEDIEEFQMSVQGVCSSPSHLSSNSSVGLAQEGSGSKSDVQMTSYQSTVSSSVVTDRVEEEPCHQISPDFISKYHLEDIMSDDFSASSRASLPVLPSAVVLSGVESSDNSFKDSVAYANASAHGSSVNSMADSLENLTSLVSGELSSGTDVFNLRLSILSDSSNSSSSSDEDGDERDDDKDRVQRAVTRTTGASRGSSVGAGSSSEAEVTATLRTSHAHRDFSEWLQEPSFSVASSNSSITSSDEDWKAGIAHSFLSNPATAVLSSVEGTLSSSSHRRSLVLSSAGSPAANLVGGSSEDEEEEDSTDRILSSWTGPAAALSSHASAREGALGLLSSDSSSSSSSEVDHIQALHRIIGANENALDFSRSSDGSGGGDSDDDGESAVYPLEVHERDEETSLGELLGLSGSSSFSLSDDTS